MILKAFLFILCFLGVIAAIVGGVYVSLWLCTIGGIIQIVHAVKATPLNDHDLAFGLLRVLCAGLFGTITFWVCFAIAGLFGFFGSLIEKNTRLRNF